jgi:hypothetical protein
MFIMNSLCVFVGASDDYFQQPLAIITENVFGLVWHNRTI